MEFFRQYRLKEFRHSFFIRKNLFIEFIVGIFGTFVNFHRVRNRDAGIRSSENRKEGVAHLFSWTALNPCFSAFLRSPGSELFRTLVFYLPVDINKDGVDDIIRIYRTRNSLFDRRWISLVEAYNQKNNRILRTTETGRVYHNSQFQELLIRAGNILIFPVRKDTGFYLQALNLQTGTPLWTYSPVINTPEIKFDYVNNARLQIRKSQLYFTYHHKLHSGSLVVLDLHTGKKLLKQKFWKLGNPHNLVFYDSHLFLKRNRLKQIDTATGQVSGSFAAGMPWKYKNKLLVLTDQKRLMELDPIKSTLKPFRPFGGKALDKDRFSEVLGLYQDSIFQTRWDKVRGRTGLFVYSLKTGASRKILQLPKNFKMSRLYRSPIQYWNIKALAYHKIPGRFLPFFASFSENQKDFRRLYILDLKHNQIAWQSKTYEASDTLYFNQVMFIKNGHYFPPSQNPTPSNFLPHEK